MREDAIVSSAETDGVGLRLCLKVPIAMSGFTMPFLTPERADELEQQKKATGRKGKKQRGKLKRTQPGPPEARPTGEVNPPIFGAADLGRAKPFMAAVSRCATKKPVSVGFTRRRYYWEMRHKPRQRWEVQRMAEHADVAAAVQVLSVTGGMHNCDPAQWMAYLNAEAMYRDLLNDEFVKNKERATWRMVMFCYKRSSLDRAAERMIKVATRGEPTSRPLVFAVGAAGFASTGRGELASPTAEVTRALERALKRVEKSGRSVMRMSVDEFRTTMCCCGCGMKTTAPMIRDPKTGEMRRSRRLRSCSTCCAPAVKLGRTDCATVTYKGRETYCSWRCTSTTVWIGHGTCAVTGTE